jgi:hypothetical protein
MNQEVVKIECRIEDWWMNSVLSDTGTLELYGNIYGHPSIPDGNYIFQWKVVAYSAKHLVVEAEDCIVKLGNPQTMEALVAKLEPKKK